MVAIGIGTPAFVAAQSLISGFAFRELKPHSLVVSAVFGFALFLCGVGAVFALDSVILPIVLQVVVICLYLVLQRVN